MLFLMKKRANSQINQLYLTDSKIRYEDIIARFKAKKDLRPFLYLVIGHIRFSFGHYRNVLFFVATKIYISSFCVSRKFVSF
jgi:hypothetical protein